MFRLLEVYFKVFKFKDVENVNRFKVIFVFDFVVDFFNYLFEVACIKCYG